ncbi:MAG: AAA family ATPase, partial [Verrucomicrobiota bacterium]
MDTHLSPLHATLDRARAEVRRVLIGQDEAIDLALVAIFTNQHALCEGVPGVAKTLLVKTLAQVLDCDFGRIQFTPDLM